MILTALLLIFAMLWKTTIAARSPTLFLRLQTGHQREDFLDLSVMFLL
jgi:hypothetical protein